MGSRYFAALIFGTSSHAAEIEYVEVDDPGIHDDIDDAAAYRELMLRESEPA